MCNCKGWDTVYIGEAVSIEPHFCRTYGDCGHVNNTLEDVAEEIYKHYKYLSDEWKNRTHPDYKFYKYQEGNTK